MTKTAYITYHDLRDILKQNIDFEFDKEIRQKGKGRIYTCLDIINEMLSKSGSPTVGDMYVNLAKAYDAGWNARKAVEKDDL
jgi:hypothetical protein